MSSRQPPPPSGAGDQARVSVSVALPRPAVFEIFTSEIDLWWRRGPKFRHAGITGGIVHLEPRQGGRLFESIDAADGQRVFEIGTVSVWDPPCRLVFSWRNENFAPHEVTEVEVCFADNGGSTLVEVTHRGWCSIPAGHPARHGLEPGPFARMIGLWWGEQMPSLRGIARDRPRIDA